MASDATGWMPLYIGDYLADTMHLNGAEHGAYLLLIMHYWRNGPLPDDNKALAAIARTDRREWAQMEATIRSFFRVEDSRLYHKRIDRELQRIAEVVSAKARAGKKGAEKRWQRDGTAMVLPLAEHNHSDGIATDPPLANGVAKNSQSQSQSHSSVLRTGETPIDAKTALWREGLQTLRLLTGQADGPTRKQLGKLVDAAGADHARLLDLIRQAEVKQPDNPVAWLMAAAQCETSGGDQLGFNAWLSRQRITETGTFDGERRPVINGYCPRGVLDDVIVAVDRGGGRWSARPNLDRLADWCRADIPAHEGWAVPIERVARRLNGPISSLAVFDAALRERVAA